MPETKGLSLEELDQVFSVPTHKHAAWGIKSFFYFIKRYILLQHCELEELYTREGETEDIGYEKASEKEKGHVR